jgi:anti-sigma regulatory factor (Ser/Thr protein kinase)
VAHLQLIMEELVVNAISYGFPEGGTHKIQVKLQRCNGRIVAEIVDDGVEFDPHDAQPPDTSGSMSDRPIGGLGIHLVKAMTDKLEYRREGNLNILRLELRCDG